MQIKSWPTRTAGLLLGLILSWPASAATIFGTITQKGQPVANAHLTLSCAGLAAPAQTQTDNRGSYHFSLAIKGYCTLAYQNGAVTTTTKVILEPSPNQYDFEVDNDASGTRLVRR